MEVKDFYDATGGMIKWFKETMDFSYLILSLFFWTIGFWLMVCVGCPLPTNYDPMVTNVMGYSCWYPTIGLVFMASGFIGLIYLTRSEP